MFSEDDAWVVDIHNSRSILYKLRKFGALVSGPVTWGTHTDRENPMNICHARGVARREPLLLKGMTSLLRPCPKWQSFQPKLQAAQDKDKHPDWDSGREKCIYTTHLFLQLQDMSDSSPTRHAESIEMSPGGGGGVELALPSNSLFEVGCQAHVVRRPIHGG